MGWVIVAFFAGIYLLVRFIQMTHFVIVHFFFNPVIPIPIKLAFVAVVVALLWVIKKGWRWYFGKPEPVK